MIRPGPSLGRPGVAAVLVLLGLGIAAPGLSGQVRVASSAFPFIDVNPNTAQPPATDRTTRVAQPTIHHDRDRLSFVELPVWKRP